MTVRDLVRTLVLPLARTLVEVAGAAPPPPFSPTDLGAAVEMWWEHDNLTTGAVTNWPDLAGTGRVWTQGTSGKRPVKDATGVKFTAASLQSMQCNALSSVFGGLNTEYTLFVVVKPDTVAAGSRDFLSAGNSGNVNPIVTHRLAADKMASSRRSASAESTITVTGTISEVANTNKLMMVRHITDMTRLDSNGAQSAPNTAFTIASITIDRVSLGSLLRTTEANYWSGWILGGLLVSRALTKAEINQVQTYFGTKYSMSMTAQDNTVVPDSFHSWWSLPAASVSPTVGQGVWTAGVRTAGDIVISNLGGLGDRILAQTVASPDDHNTPAILMPSDKVPLVAYTHHNADAVLRTRKGAVIGDPHNLTTPVNKTMSGVTSYVQLWRQPSTDNVWMFSRIATSSWGITKSTDYGATWGAEQLVFDTGGANNQIYVTTKKVAADPDLIRCMMYGHPTASTIHDGYYCTIRLSTGDIAKVDGTVVGNLDGTNLPLNMTTLSKVFDISNLGYSGSRLFDVSDGPIPEVAFAVWNDDTDSTYCYAAYVAGVWTFKTITNSGLPFGYTVDIHYIGGMTFPDNTTGGILYLSRQGSANVWTIEKKVTADGGDNWTTTVEITNNNDGHMCIRPFALPLGNTSGFRLIYIDCTHYGTNSTAYQDFAGSVKGLV